MFDTVQESQHENVVVAALASFVQIHQKIHQKSNNTRNAAYHCDEIDDDLAVFHWGANEIVRERE